MFLADLAPLPGIPPLTPEQQMWFVAIAGAALALCLAAMGLIVWRLFRRRPTLQEPGRHELTMKIGELPANGPPPGAPQLEFYGTPVRLAVLVVAPVGRGGVVPGLAEFPTIADDLLPDLKNVLAAHQPLYIPWPNQLSTQGFMQAFFNKLALPGDHGKGTPWCSVAGKFDARGEQYLAGLVCCAATPNSLGEATVDHPGQWLSVLRVKV